MCCKQGQSKCASAGQNKSGKRCAKVRIELHLHLDGAVRVNTIRELAIAANNPLQNKSEREIAELTSVHRPSTLQHFLSKLSVYLSLLVGNPKAIERIAYELCEDESTQQVIYFEARYSPHLLANTVKHFFNEHPVSPDSPSAVTPSDVVKLVAKGLRRGQNDFGVKARMILCSIKGQNSWSKEVVELASQFASEGVVAIDIAGDESAYTQEEVDAFKAAKERSIHRTVHAGESGPASHVAFAVEKLFAERIGHGYRVLADQKVYQMCRARNIHFETCPWSSILTGAVKAEDRHPIVTFAEDGVNFSVNKDDPTVTKTTLDTEYSFLRDRGVTECQLMQANLNAARSSFLPEAEKQALVERVNRESWCGGPQ